jgi:CTP:phosphocholine cytidylyltransferase-like protein
MLDRLFPPCNIIHIIHVNVIFNYNNFLSTYAHYYSLYFGKELVNNSYLLSGGVSADNIYITFHDCLSVCWVLDFFKK